MIDVGTFLYIIVNGYLFAMWVGLLLEIRRYRALKLEVAALEKELECLLGSD